MPEFLEVNPSERKIVQEIRTLRPFERIEICADKDGKPATFLVTRTARMVLSVGVISPAK